MTHKHPNGRPFGMGRRSWFLMNKTPTGSLANKVAANKFAAEIKEHGLTEALRMNGIAEDRS